VLLIGGGILSVLPLLGIWMLPLGLMLLAEDLPPLRRVRDRVLDSVARHRPRWFAEARS
jgi:predicted DCC family thiol-disulfide oxidoreductase YuxK